MLKKKSILGFTLVAIIGLGIGLGSISSAASTDDNPIDDQNTIVVDNPDTGDVLIGTGPGSCGYQWDAEREGWRRPWEPDSFFPAEDKPEWADFIPASSDGMIIQQAPIHDVQVNIAESYPPQIFVYIQGGLSGGCTTFHDLTVARDGNTITIDVTVQHPEMGACTAIYGYFDKNVGLGTDFTPGETYTIIVNGETTEFVMQ